MGVRERETAGEIDRVGEKKKESWREEESGWERDSG